MSQPGLQTLPQANPGGGLPQQMAGPVPAGQGGQAPLPNQGAIPPGL